MKKTNFNYINWGIFFILVSISSSKLFALNRTFIYSVPSGNSSNFDAKINTTNKYGKYRLCDQSKDSEEEFSLKAGKGICLQSNYSTLDISIKKYPSSTIYLQEKTWDKLGGLESLHNYTVPMNATDMVYISKENYNYGYMYFLTVTKEIIKGSNDHRDSNKEWLLNKNILFSEDKQPVAVLYAIPSNAVSDLEPSSDPGFVAILIYKSDGDAKDFAKQVSSTYFDFLDSYSGDYEELDHKLKNFLESKDPNLKQTILWYHETLSELEPSLIKIINASRKHQKRIEWVNAASGIVSLFSPGGFTAFNPIQGSMITSISGKQGYTNPSGNPFAGITALIEMYKKINILDQIKPKACSSLEKLNGSAFILQGTCNGQTSTINFARCFS